VMLQKIKKALLELIDKVYETSNLRDKENESMF
jgi:hypothetical protein